MTVNGRLRLLRVRWHCREEGASTPIDRWLDEAESTVSQGARELICRLNQSSASFRKTSENLKRAAQIASNPETIRGLVEDEGKAALAALRQDKLPPEWKASDCRVESGKSRVYVSCDGVKVPTITDAEKKTRRRKTLEKRRRRGRRCKPLPRVRPGSDNAWKEFRLVAHYDETQSHCHVSVTRGNHEAAGRLMARDARAVRLREADERIANVDGAPWIRSQLEFHGTVDHVGLDFYHLAEHVHQTRRDVFGEKNDDGSAWAEKVLHVLKHDGYEPAWQLVVECRRTACAAGRDSVDRLLGYMSERREMIRYPEFRARGWQIGSGPIEAQCKTTTARVKGSGKRWDAANAEAVMALACLENSRLWEKHWQVADRAKK